jgi:UDP:flavonoid glycosyltransferase YjiC (YdhE family)
MRLLIFAEAVTLAHVARPVALAAGLEHDVHFAASPRFDPLLGDLQYARHDLDSIPTERFLRALDRGEPVYSADDLRRYVRDDLALIGRVAPDVVVGDFRLSLSVSARLARVPYATIASIHWSPCAQVEFPLPELPVTRVLGVRPAVRKAFGLVRPLAFALHTKPLNTVRREYGLPALGRDLRLTYTDADEVLYADAPELAPPHLLAPGHRFLGPVLWSPAVPEPEWWDRVPTERPVVYVTLGSSGRPGLLDAALHGLEDLPVTVLAASAGRGGSGYVADYLPGMAACERAALVVCNGGSLTVQQALCAGRPVLGLPANMDQHLAMAPVVAAGAALIVRSEHATGGAIAGAARRLLEEPSFRANAEALAPALRAHDAPARFAQALDSIIRRSSGSRVERAAAGGPEPSRP